MSAYSGKDDLEALSNFVIASGMTDEALRDQVWAAVANLNQKIKNADVVGLKVDIIKGMHIWMDSPQLWFSITRDGGDIA
jgi:hypothetical protein